jgi:hypothetical protein
LYSSVRGNVSDFADLADMAESFERETQRIGDEHALFDECAGCAHRADGTCAGGCYALRALSGMQQRAADAGASIDDDDAFFEAVPRLDASRVHETMRSGQPVFLLKDAEGTWSQVALGPGEDRVLRACDGSRTVREVIDVVGQQQLRRYSRAGVARTLRGLFARGALELSSSSRALELGRSRAPGLGRARLPVIA